MIKDDNELAIEEDVYDAVVLQQIIPQLWSMHYEGDTEMAITIAEGGWFW
jgi:hypothetical protein